jgi:hypothetical protein
MKITINIQTIIYREGTVNATDYFFPIQMAQAFPKQLQNWKQLQNLKQLQNWKQLHSANLKINPLKEFDMAWK